MTLLTHTDVLLREHWYLSSSDLLSQKGLCLDGGDLGWLRSHKHSCIFNKQEMTLLQISIVTTLSILECPLFLHLFHKTRAPLSRSLRFVAYSSPSLLTSQSSELCRLLHSMGSYNLN